jgi:hypothetical protein
VANTLSGGHRRGADRYPAHQLDELPDSGLIQIGSEQIRYATVTGNDLEGVTRGVNGTLPASHLSGAAVDCATLIVTDVDHGALDNDFVTYSGAVSLGSQITAAILNQEYQIVSIVDDDNYLIEARTVATISSHHDVWWLAPTPVFADSSDTGDGGAAVVGAYQINTGLDTTITGNGWGAGTWGRSTWGSGASLLVSGSQLRIWSHDNFGEDLLYNVRDGGIFYWDKTSGLTSRGVALSSLSGANATPTVAKQVLVSDQDRHVIAFGCDSQADPGTQDPLLIRFSSQESLTDWAATATNTAGDLRLGSGSQIVTAVETRQQILIYTDNSLYAMQYLGPPFTFGVQLISENITIGGPLTAMAVDDQVFWMGLSEFYVYNGSVQRLPCSVRDYVFEDMNLSQMEKVTAALNSENSEIWWFYPSAASKKTTAMSSTTTWSRRGTTERLPGRHGWTAASRTSRLPQRPTTTSITMSLAFDDGSTSPASAISAYVTSSPIDLGDGEDFVFVRRLLPDVSFRNSSAPVPEIDITTRVRNYTNTGYLRTTTST